MFSGFVVQFYIFYFMLCSCQFSMIFVEKPTKKSVEIVNWMGFRLLRDENVCPQGIFDQLF